MDKKIILILILIMMTIIVNATHDLTYDNYMEVNVSEEITIKDGDISQENALLFLDGQTTIFTKDSQNTTFSLFITNDQEQDFQFFIQIFNKSLIYEQINNSDGIRNNEILINDSKLYSFKQINSGNHTVGDPEDHNICPYLKKGMGLDRHINTFVAYDNGTDLIFTIGNNNQLINNPTYDYFCLDNPHIYQDNVTNYDEYYGFYCTDCTTSNTIRLGTDNTVIFNNSYLFTNSTSTPTQILTTNYMIRMLELEGEPIEEYTGTFKFRIPFYLNISIIDNYNTTFNPIFNYLYLRDSSIDSTTKYADIGSSISKVLTLGYVDRTPTSDYTETFWTELDSNSKGQIKLYEQGNYSITMLTLKTFKPGFWPYEFYKPQYTKNKVETTLDTNLEITSEIDQELLIQASEYELNKAGLVFNIVKWVVFIIFAIGGVIVAFYTPNPMVAIGALLTIILPIIYKVLF